MQNYVSPIIYDNDELAEGVYASGSGSDADCWTIDYTVPQNWNGQAKVIEVKCSHKKTVYHTSTGLVATLVFDKAPSSVTAENNSDYQIVTSGNTVEVTRSLNGNAFYSGDEVTFKLFVTCLTQAETEAINVLQKSIRCIHN